MSEIKEVLLALSMSFDNFLEVQKSSSTQFTPKSTSEYSYKNENMKSFHKFQRPNRRTGSPTESDGISRKRSLESDEKGPTEARPEDLFNDISSNNSSYNGKRSKSLVLTQELEGLHVSLLTNTSSKAIYRLESELKEWADHDLKTTISAIEGFEDLKRELEACAPNRVDDILKVLASFTDNNYNSRTYMNDWIKWAVINEVTESLKSSECPAKTVLNRSIKMLVALHKISTFLDWSDPELSFLLHKFMIQFLNYGKFKHHKNDRLNRRLEEFMGILRALNLFCRLPFHASAQFFLLSRPETLAQIVELLENLFEANLNIFELTATQTIFINDDFTSFNLTTASILLTLKVFESFAQGAQGKEIREIILNVKNRIV